MLKLRVTNGMGRLKAVIFGTAVSNGVTLVLKGAYDPKSAEHIKAGIYPIEKDMAAEMDAFVAVLQKYSVQVCRSEIIRGCNQIFTRDIGFVTDDVSIKTNTLPDRQAEFQTIEYMVEQMNLDRAVTPPEEVHTEGGDVMPWNKYIFIGTCKGDGHKEQATAHTNMTGAVFIQKLSPHKRIKESDLVKLRTEARGNALRLDCCFQLVGKDKTTIYKEGFRSGANYQCLIDIFGAENPFHMEREEMYEMNSNVFSISLEVVVSERHFTRLNVWFRAQGLTVEEVPYSEISKREGLLRCSTLPLLRDN